MNPDFADMGRMPPANPIGTGPPLAGSGAIPTFLEMAMKIQLSAAVSGLLFIAGAASAQSVVITPEQETVIREYVVTQEVHPVEIPSDVTIEVGSTLPETVELYALEVPEAEVTYQYVIVDDRTVLVEPQTRRIVHIIQ